MKLAKSIALVFLASIIFAQELHRQTMQQIINLELSRNCWTYAKWLEPERRGYFEVDPNGTLTHCFNAKAFQVYRQTADGGTIVIETVPARPTCEEFEQELLDAGAPEKR